MSRRALTRVAVLAAVLVVLVALGLAYFLIPPNKEDDPGSRGDDAPGMPEDRDQQDDVGQ